MAANYLEMLKLLAIDGLFVVVLALLLAPLAQYKKAAFAVLKRNFVGYFANPTGYVFLCLFVFLTSAAAFWPHDFFIANLANLDQLNKYMPLIMLVFVPAIGMSASFLTPYLTVSFILGVLFNAVPLMTYYADVLFSTSATARQVSQWSIAAQFDDFGRGVIALSSTAFFVLIVVFGVYLSMV